MSDEVDSAILRTLKQLEGAHPSPLFSSADDITALVHLPRWEVASHLTRLVVDGYLEPDPQWGIVPAYHLTPRGAVRPARSRSEQREAHQIEDAVASAEAGAGEPRADPAPMPVSQETPLERPHLKHGHILVVDDDDSVRVVVSAILTDEAYDVTTASNGVEALQAIDDDPPAVMLLDMRMPVCDGWDVARCLHERQSWIPTVVMSAAQYAPTWCVEVQADACLSKPFSLDELLSAVEGVLAQQRGG